MAKRTLPMVEITDVHLDPQTQAGVNAMARVLGRTPEGFAISAIEHDLLNGPHRETYLEIKAGLGEAAGPHGSLS